MNNEATQKNNSGSTVNLQKEITFETYAGEQQGPQWRIDNVEDLVAEKDAEDREEEENDQAHKKYAPAGGEVIFGLWLKKQKKSIFNKYNHGGFKKEWTQSTSLNIQK